VPRTGDGDGEDENEDYNQAGGFKPPVSRGRPTREASSAEAVG